MSEQHVYEPTDVCDEVFCDEGGGFSWVVKSDRVPTSAKARQVVAQSEGEPYTDYDCWSRRARIEWRDDEGCWWLTVDPVGTYDVWEVYYR